MCAAKVIPDEILFDHIFSRLPFKLISRFKCLSKQWNRKFSDPDFARKHLILNQQRNENLAIETYEVYGDSIYIKFFSVDHEANTDNSADAVELNVGSPVSESRIMGSSNGLLCVFLHYPRRFYTYNGKTRYYRKKDLVIWNPSTGDSKLIRNPPCPYNVFNLGFCYDPSINDAKIVCFNSFRPQNPFRPMKSGADIYSLKSNNWEIFEDPNFDLENIESLIEGCTVDKSGSIYWLVHNYNTDTQDILEFNIKDSKFRKFDTPSHYIIDGSTGLRVFGGFVSLYGSSTDKEFVLWTMKEGEWERMISINYWDLKFGYFSLCCFVPKCLMRNGKYLCYYDKKSVYVLNSISKYVLFDPETEELEDSDINGISGALFHGGMTYIQSLISPKTITSL